MMNQALRDFMDGKSNEMGEGLEEALRRVLGEVLPASRPKRKARSRS